MKLADAAQDFLAQPRVAVVGVSRRPGHVTNYVFKKLRAAGREVIPVNPAASEIEGVRCYPDLRSIPGTVSAVLVITPPHAAASVVRECVDLGIKRVWLHRSLGVGSAPEEAVRIAREGQLRLIPSGCPMMFCEPVDVAHRCFRWCLQLTRRLPATIEA